MLAMKPVGRNASARKDDILTALGAYALARGKHEQRLVLRFVTLMTARYNWAREEWAVGQREIAARWSVDERTVKRDMAKLRGLGWLVVKRQGARGRVTQYGIALETVLRATKPQWEAVGPDFALRMQGAPEQARDVAQAILYQEDQSSFGAWLSALRRVERAGGRLTLKAPSRFHAAYVSTHLMGRVEAACQAVDEGVTEILLIV